MAFNIVANNPSGGKKKSSFDSEAAKKALWQGRQPGTGTSAVVYKDPGGTVNSTRNSSSSNSGGGGPSAAYLAQQRANASARAASQKQNDATRSLVDQQVALLDSFGKQRDTKLGNITRALESAQKLLLENYNKTFGSLQGNLTDNEKAESDTSFRNVSNAIRERGDILAEAAMQGAGETDLLRSQLQALRNYSANQGETNRSFYDTLRSINNSITSLNTDTATSRTNLFNQAENDREAAWANYYNQMADTWTQIGNIENSNTNVDSDTSVAYQKRYGSAAQEAAKNTKGSYTRATAPAKLTEWDGKGETSDRELASTNRAATVNLGGPQKRAEGATLRKW